MTILTRNWEYKVISIFFAIALYFYFSDQISIGKTLQVPRLDAQNIVVPPQYIVTDVEPSHLTIGIRGPKSLITRIDDTVIPHIVLTETDLLRPVVTVSVTSRLLGFDPKVMIEQVGPQADIQVRVEAVTRKRVPISDQISVRLPQGLGYRIAKEQTDLLVRGPAGLLAELRWLEVRPIDLSDVPADLKRELRRDIPLDILLPPTVELVDQRPTGVQVTIIPAPASRVVSVPVRVITPPQFGRNYRISLNQEEVTVTVRGPQNLLDSLNPKEQVKALVDIDPNDPGWSLDEPRNVPIRFDAPSWLSPSSSQVRVTLSAATAEDTPP